MDTKEPFEQHDQGQVPQEPQIKEQTSQSEQSVQELTPSEQEKLLGETYSVMDQALIQQLIKSRLDQKAELEYDNLDGYEVPPPTQFSMLKKPAVNIRYGKLCFNTAAVRLFSGIKYVLPLIHPEKKRLTIIMCTEEESASVQWARCKDELWCTRDITSEDFTANVYKMMKWDSNCRYKAMGRIANSPRGLILIFDLNEAIMFTQKPFEYVDKETGLVKKKKVKYYPDQYKDHIGKTYDDYFATRQTSMFEQFDGYVGQDDAPQNTDAGDPQADQINHASPAVETGSLPGQHTPMSNAIVSQSGLGTQITAEPQSIMEPHPVIEPQMGGMTHDQNSND
ncbi:MAG: hypothetical protein PHI98_16920 [Eubacteriales bacterium]|nr:hypothetical protein [Eubacteriales bacterium]